MNTQLPSNSWSSQWRQGWDQFWFAPLAPHTLALIRIATGAMLFYTHLIWALDLQAFLGSKSWVSTDISRFLQEGNWTWSYLWYISSPTLLWTTHLAGMAVFAMLSLGIFTRVTSVIAWLIALCYCHRLEGALFGLDQINVLLAMYLAISPSGQVYSIDSWWTKRGTSSGAKGTNATIRANISTRLIQLHLCTIYLFGGIGKMRGSEWWDGSASWLALANPEYQSLDMTWLASHHLVLSAITHITVFWEVFFCVLIWPRLTRPVMLLLAIAVHTGIALCLGMVTFGCIMLIANMAFISPETTRRCLDRLLRGRAGQT